MMKESYKHLLDKHKLCESVTYGIGDLNETERCRLDARAHNWKMRGDQERQELVLIMDCRTQHSHCCLNAFSELDKALT